LRYCPFCGKAHGEKVDNLWKLYVRKADGAFFCHRCGNSGSWWDFKQRLGDLPDGESAAASVINGGSIAGGTAGARGGEFGAGSASSGKGVAMRTVGMQTVLTARDALLERGEFPAVLDYLTGKRQLGMDVLREYCVGAVKRQFPVDGDAGVVGGSGAGEQWVAHDCITMPWLHDPAAVGGHRQQHGDGATSAQAAAASGMMSAAMGGGPANASESSLRAQQHVVGGASDFLCSRMKLRSLTDKSKQLLQPRGGGWGMFGMHTVPADATSVVLTEGEFDAMSVRQATGRHAVSLPNGCRSFPVELLPWLERFERVYLWMDDDVAGREGSERISAKLGIGRCYLVRPRAELLVPAAGSLRAAVGDGPGAADTGGSAAPAPSVPPPKDANEALQRHLDLELLVAAAAPRPHDQILTFDDLRSAVMREMAAALGQPLDGQDAGGEGDGGRWGAAGAPLRCLPGLHAIVKGHRSGEVTIVTGPTGSGKTTLLSQLSLDLAAQGVRTLWGSFEIKSTRLIGTMLHQLQGGRIPLPGAPAPVLVAADGPSVGGGGGAGTVAGYEAAADALAGMPLHFLRFYGSTDVDRVLDALEYAAYVHDVQHVLLDNLQFMMSSATSGRGLDKFDIQDRALDRFRAFATKHDVHVTLVIHPRKEEDNVQLSLSSVFGGAKATQEADTVIILQKDGSDGHKYLDVRKNRYDGALGTVHLGFDPACKSFFDVHAAEYPVPLAKEVAGTSRQGGAVGGGSQSRRAAGTTAVAAAGTRGNSRQWGGSAGAGSAARAMAQVDLAAIGGMQVLGGTLGSHPQDVTGDVPALVTVATAAIAASAATTPPVAAAAQAAEMQPLIEKSGVSDVAAPVVHVPVRAAAAAPAAAEVAATAGAGTLPATAKVARVSTKRAWSPAGKKAGSGSGAAGGGGPSPSSGSGGGGGNPFHFGTDRFPIADVAAPHEKQHAAVMPR
jgi:twinkle protein